jgi:hypothetical protein
MGNPVQTTAHSGVKVWATNLSGQYPNNANFILKTQPITVGNGAVLSFWHLLQCESSWDGGNVAVSNNGGSTWNIIQPASGGSYIANVIGMSEPGFSGGPSTWTEVTFSLSQFANQEIIIRWRFGSDTSVQGNGWFIDDVMITGYSIKTGIISGTVTLSNPDNPQAATVASQDRFVTNPDSDGDYALYLPAGTYNLTASMPFYQSMSSPAITLTEQALTFTQDFILIYLPAPVRAGGLLRAKSISGHSHLERTGGPHVSRACLQDLPQDGTRKLFSDRTGLRTGLCGQSHSGRALLVLCQSLVQRWRWRAFRNRGPHLSVVSNPEEPVIIPVNALSANFPNPFNPETTISYSVAKAGEVSLRVYNTKGQLVKTLVSENKASGKHTAVWNGMDDHGKPVSSGMYLYRMQTGKFTSTRKMMLMK